jgi:DNA-binding XRE family transcriptional regulator
LVNHKKMSYSEIVGIHLKRRRQEFGMTQAEFAETIGLSEKGYAKIERGKNAPVFVNIDLSQSDHFKSEPLLPKLLPYMGEGWGFRVFCPEGQNTLNPWHHLLTGYFHPFVS